MLPVLYCSLNCQQRDYNRPSRPHRVYCQARQQAQFTRPNIELDKLRADLDQERIRSNDISRDNQSLQGRIKNYQDEIAIREKGYFLFFQ